MSGELLMVITQKLQRAAIVLSPPPVLTFSLAWKGKLVTLKDVGQRGNFVIGKYMSHMKTWINMRGLAVLGWRDLKSHDSIPKRQLSSFSAIKQCIYIYVCVCVCVCIKYYMYNIYVNWNKIYIVIYMLSRTRHFLILLLSYYNNNSD